MDKHVQSKISELSSIESNISSISDELHLIPLRCLQRVNLASPEEIILSY
jgi:hypothetical protein